MKQKAIKLFRLMHPRRLSATLTIFLRDESISGKLILAATAVALLIVNSPLSVPYEAFWHTKLTIGAGSWLLAMDIRHWVNEGLMAIFFLVVGLEIKRELVFGELRNLKITALPIAAAVGGMLLPALIYVLLNQNPVHIRGWGIPIATDIAFAVGILMLLGKRVPLQLKIFLLTLAIADDIGAIFIIALFYAEIIHYGYLAAAVALLLSTWLLRRQFIGRAALYLLTGVVLWVLTHKSGIHASIVGAAIGLLAPIRPNRAGRGDAEQLERTFLPISTFIALPVFALANAGIPLAVQGLNGAAAGNVPLGIIAGLSIGKPVGILLATWLLVRLGISRLPDGVNWLHVLGVGCIAGIGFTVSIFMTELAFAGNTSLLNTAKLSIFIASALSALLGTICLFWAHKRSRSVTFPQQF